jgi:hypothetical protein
MNANELADWLDKVTDSEDWGELAKYYKWCKENVATMLRQQQAEIDKLKNLLLDNQILLDKTLNAWAKEMERRK